MPTTVIPSKTENLAFPSVSAHLHRYHNILEKHQVSPTSSVRNQLLTIHHRGPVPGMNSARRLDYLKKNIPLRSDSRTFYPTYISPFIIDRVVNPASAQFTLPGSMRIQQFSMCHNSCDTPSFMLPFDHI